MGQQQQQQQGQCGENVLFYGCRDDADYIYRSELEGMSSSATTSNTTIDALEVAFSRKQAQGVAKTYVQQRIAASASQMLALLNKGAHVYVCGDASKMAPDVKAAFTRILAAGGDADAEAGRRDAQDCRERSCSWRSVSCSIPDASYEY